MFIKIYSLMYYIFMIYCVLNVFGESCFDFDEQMKSCARLSNVPIPVDSIIGYDFGYGSLNETEHMCKTKSHIVVFQCMHDRILRQCKDTNEEKYIKFIWSITLDIERFRHAARYICYEHNLKIFRDHKEDCLRKQEKAVEVCAQNRNHTIAKVVSELQSKDDIIHQNNNEYLQKLKNILSEYECKTLVAKLECLYSVLHTNCHPDAVRLILNYFKETLPENCQFLYENRLQNYLHMIHHEQMKPNLRPLVQVMHDVPNEQLSDDTYVEVNDQGHLHLTIDQSNTGGPKYIHKLYRLHILAILLALNL